MQYTLGSLFDGSGGFPLAGALCGIEPRWASEVEPYPIAVTRERFPNMKHLGDISKVNGAEIEPVDIITFGSPCQDLSVAGKRAGLKHEDNGDEETTRSGLFMEAVRIIREMREATNGKYPNFALWENVPGAFSSNKGEDFRTVLAELINIVEPGAVMPPVPKAGWNYADSYTGDGWSLAYRVFDAQYWGVPQRRRRIHLVLDLRGGRAREVLFEREGVRGYFAQGRTPWQGAAAHAEGSAGADDREGENNCLTACYPDVAHSLAARHDGSPQPDKRNGANIVVQAKEAYVWPLGFRPENTRMFEEKATTLCNGTRPGFANGVVRITKTYDARGNGDGETVNTLRGDHNNRITDYSTLVVEQGQSGTVYCMAHGQANAEICADMSPTLNCNHEQPIVFDKETYNSGLNASGGHYIAEGGPAPSLKTKHPPGVCVQYIVRRLTPTECARLQGFADRWGDIGQKDSFTPEEYRFWLEARNTHAAINGREAKEYTEAQILTWYNKLHSDGSEYKMWGNGIALPPALYCMQGIADALAAYENREEAGETADLSGEPEEIKEAIMENAEKTAMREAEQPTAEQDHGFNAVDQLKRLKSEREALAGLHPEKVRFADDVRAIEYAVGVLEAVGL